MKLIFRMHSKKEMVPPVNLSVAYFMRTLASLNDMYRSQCFDCNLMPFE